MNARGLETCIAWFTLCALIIYVPGETYVSLPGGLSNPFYLVDLTAMILMFWAAVHSLRARPDCAPGLLCAAYGRAAANGWRSTFWRIGELRKGGLLEYGDTEMWIVCVATAIALLCFAILLALTAINSPIRRQ